MPKQQNTASNVDSLRAAIGSFTEPAEIAALREKLAHFESRLAEIEAAVEANRAEMSAATASDAIDRYIDGASDPHAERAKLIGERTVCSDAVRALRARIDTARAHARAEFCASRDVAAPVAAQREKLVAAAVTLFDALRDSRDMTALGESAGVSLAGPRWTGYLPGSRAAVAVLLVNLAEVGTPVHPAVVAEARDVINGRTA